MSIRLLYHDPKSPSDDSPFNDAICSIAREGQLSLACPYISLDYLNGVINGTSWRLLTDIKELLRSTKNLTQRERVVEFLSDHRASVRHYSRLHAKVVIGLRTVMFGSANFTNSGIWKRTEVSAIIDDAPQVQELTEWFEACWLSPQAQEMPSKDAMAEYIKSLPEAPSPAEEVEPPLFPPLLTKPASLAELEVQQVATGEAAEQPAERQQAEAEAKEPQPEPQSPDDVAFPYVNLSKPRKLKRGKRGKYDYLYPLLTVALHANPVNAPLLRELAKAMDTWKTSTKPSVRRVVEACHAITDAPTTLATVRERAAAKEDRLTSPHYDKFKTPEHIATIAAELGCTPESAVVG